MTGPIFGTTACWTVELLLLVMASFNQALKSIAKQKTTHLYGLGGVMAEIYTPFVRRSIDIKHQGNKEWMLRLGCDLAVPLALSASMRSISGAPWYLLVDVLEKEGGLPQSMCTR